MTHPIFSGELGSWQGIRVVDRDHFCPSWRRPLAWLAHRYRWPIGCDPLDLLCDDLEDPSYDRLYDTLLPDDYEKPSDVIRRWASKIWAGLGQDVYFGKFAESPGPAPAATTDRPRARAARVRDDR